MSNSVWTRPPRGRGEQPTLGRDQIVKAAIDLLDAEGESGLSMRRLGTALGSGATSVYWHVANKDELLELAVDQVFGEIYVPEPGDTSWRIGVSVMANSMRTMMLSHPWVVGQLGARPTIGPNALRLGDRMVSLLTAAGFSGIAVTHVGSLISSHTIGASTTQAAMIAESRRAGVGWDEVIERLDPHLERLSAEHPSYRRWREENGSLPLPAQQLLDETFAFGLERLLDGLELWLEAQPA